MANTMQSIDLNSYTHVAPENQGILRQGDDASAYRGSNAANNVNEMLYLDYGLSYFGKLPSGDAAFLFTFSFMNYYDGEGDYLIWAVSNGIANPGSWTPGLSEALYLKGSGKNTLTLGNAFSFSEDSWSGLQPEVRYWCSVYRNPDAIPSNPDWLYCDIYGSAARTDALAQLSINVDNTSYHRHHLSGATWNNGASAWGRWGIIEQELGKNTDWPY